MIKKILKGLVLTIAAVAAVILCLDSFGGYFLDGPLGPIPGGQMSGPVVDATTPLDALMALRELKDLLERS